MAGSQSSRRHHVKGRIREAVQGGRPGRWLERLTRFGYATRGVVFTLIGIFSMRAAIGIGRAAGTEEAILAIYAQPFGQALAGLTGIGLVCYTLWRFVQAAFDPIHEVAGESSTVRRIGYVGSGLFYALLAFSALQLSFGIPLQAGEARREWTAWALTIPYGTWVVMLVGIILIGVGAHAFYRAGASTFMRLYPRNHREGRKRAVIKRVGQIGLTALGVTLCIIGSFVIAAGRYSDPEVAIGIAGALQALGEGPYGPLLLGAAGLGFVIYGVHCFALARYRQVRPPASRYSQGGGGD